MKEPRKVSKGDGAGETVRNVNRRVVLSVLVWWAAALFVAGPVALLLLFATQYDVRTAAVFTAVLSPFVVLCSSCSAWPFGKPCGWFGTAACSFASRPAPRC